MAQLLAAHGTPVSADLVSKLEGAFAGYSALYPEDDPAESGYHGAIAWAKSVEGHKPFQIAIEHGMHVEASAALALGHINPADCAGRKAQVLRSAAATGCAATRTLARLGLGGWCPESHHLHHASVRAAVKTLLLVANRLVAEQHHGRSRTPVLLPELWIIVIKCIRRSWWAVPPHASVDQDDGGCTGGLRPTSENRV